MARFDKLNLEMADNKIKFGNNADIYYDNGLVISAGSVSFSSPVSGVTTSGSSPSVLATRKYFGDKFESGSRAYTDIAGNQLIPHADWTKVENNKDYFYGYDKLDEYSIYSYRFKAKEAGFYHGYGSVLFIEMPDGGRNIVEIRKNDSVIYRGEDLRNGNAGATAPNISTIIKMERGDYIELWCYQWNPGSSDIYISSQEIYNFIVQRIA